MFQKHLIIGLFSLFICGYAVTAVADEINQKVYLETFQKAMDAAENEAYDQAIVYWESLIEAYPNDLALMNNLAVVYMKQGDYLKAQKLLEKALNSDAKVSLVLKNLNDIYSYEAKLAYQTVFKETELNEPAGVWFSEQALAVEAPDIRKVNQISNDIKQVLNSTENWRQAWAGQKLQAYINFYKSKYQPNAKTSHKNWLAARKRSVTKPKFINIELFGFETMPVSEGVIQVSFYQKYESNRFKDTIRKRLTWQKFDAGWRIVEERVIRG